jgi:hypothetical protein
MTDFKVILSSNSVFNIRLQEKSSNKIIPTTGGLQVPANLQDLLDVQINNDNKKDKYVLMYDVTLNKYKLVNPDEVLSASSNTETTQPGLPGNFINTLDVDLDNKIDLDAGTF